MTLSVTFKTEKMTSSGGGFMSSMRALLFGTPSETKRVVTSPSSGVPETKGPVTSLSSGDVTDLRPTLNEGGEQILSEFFNPDNMISLRLLAIKVGSEGFVVPGNPAVMSAYSGVMLPFANEYVTKGTPIPHLSSELSITLSPKVFISAWSYINGLTHRFQYQQNTLTDDAMLYLWLRAFDVDVNKSMNLGDWLVHFSNNLGTRIITELKTKPDAVSEGAWRWHLQHGNVYGSMIVRDTKLSDTEKKLLTAIYEDLASTCKLQTPDKPRTCRMIDDFADVLEAPRFEYILNEQPTRNDYISTEVKDYVTGPAIKLDSKEPNLSPYVVFGNEASVNASIIFSTDPAYARHFYPSLIVGEERVTVYGNPLVMSIYSDLFTRLTERELDTAAYPKLASNIKIGDSPRAFLAVWLYMNGINDTLTPNLSVLEMIQMWEWMNYFDIKSQLDMGEWLHRIVLTFASRVGIVSLHRIKGRESLLSEVKMNDTEKKTLLSVHAKLLPRCKRELESYKFDYDKLCSESHFGPLEIMLGIAPDSRVKIVTYDRKMDFAQNSYHTYGNAISFKLDSMKPDEIEIVAGQIGSRTEGDTKDDRISIFNNFSNDLLKNLRILGIPMVSGNNDSKVKNNKDDVSRRLKKSTIDHLLSIARALGINTVDRSPEQIKSDIYNAFLVNPDLVLEEFAKVFG